MRGTGFAEQACCRLVLAHGRRHGDGGIKSVCECDSLFQHAFREAVDLSAVLLGEVRSAVARRVRDPQRPTASSRLARGPPHRPRRMVGAIGADHDRSCHGHA